jgi:N-6 DNA Methylase
MVASDNPPPEADGAAVWRALDRHHGRRMDLPDVFTFLQEEGLAPNWRTLARLSRHGVWEQVPTEAMADFISAVIGPNQGARLLDPWAGSGVLLAAVATASGAGSCRGFMTQSVLRSLAQQLLPDATWEVGDPLSGLAALQDGPSRFDLVVSNPPFGLRPSSSMTPADSDRRIAKFTMDQRLVLASATLLSDEGRAFFVLPDTFLLKPGSGPRALLQEHGLHIWSVISLPASWNSNTSIPLNLVEIRPRPVDEIFLAKASPDSPNAALLKNLGDHRRGKVAEVGSLVAPDALTTWDAFETALSFETAARSFGGAVVAELSSVVVEKYRGNRVPDGGFEDRPNAVFVPTLGTSPAVTSRSALIIKPHNYIQLTLDPTRADADYVAQYLSTPLGHLTRKTAYTGVIPTASLSTIGAAPIVLPPIEEQIHMVGLQRRIGELQSQLAAAERDLWRSKDGAKVVSRALHAFHQEDTLETWLPRLPYPLSSILWNYQATLDPRRQTEILLAFFEATAEFVSTILLSGLRSNASIYEQLKRGSLSEIEGTRWRDATLGFWIVTGMNLAKTVRRMLSDEERLVCLDLFRCSGTWLDAMASKDLFAVVQRVGELRNAWKGHGGIESDQETAQRLERLQSELTALLTPLTLAFEDLTLVRPKTMQYDGQVYSVVAEDLIGSAVPFRETTFQTITPMKTGGLYILEREGRDGLRLLPFVRMRAGIPAATACYFYSRLGKDGARFVSYHQALESELTEQDRDLSALVDELSGSNK